jgi:hypothetical protein
MSLKKPPLRRKLRTRRANNAGTMRLSVITGLALALSACGGEQASAPGAVSPGEAKALEEAAAMLDERRLPPEALPPEAAPADLAGTAAPPSGTEAQPETPLREGTSRP